ncbi:hypothetical protein V6A89_003813 [Enterobacter hormaechei]
MIANIGRTRFSIRCDDENARSFIPSLKGRAAARRYSHWQAIGGIYKTGLFHRVLKTAVDVT